MEGINRSDTFFVSGLDLPNARYGSKAVLGFCAETGTLNVMSQHHH
jgi:hypothetical protein